MKYLQHALLCCVLLSATPAPGSAGQDQDAVSMVERHYSGLTNLTARVTQKNHLKSVDKIQKFDAQLRIRKPGKLRLDYTNGQVILVNDRAALFYSRKSEQVIRKTFTDFQQMNIPVAFLLGAGHIRDDFDVRLPDPTAPRTLELVPKKTGAAMKNMRLAVDDEGRITRLTINGKWEI